MGLRASQNTFGRFQFDFVCFPIRFRINLISDLAERDSNAKK